jgi:peptidoglycan/xylan/chitin deacetylase (PgdA/CDA1 family)
MQYLSMFRFRSLWCGVMVLAMLVPTASFAQSDSKKKTPKKEICLTFDELPEAASFGESDRNAIAYLTLQTLKSYEIKAAGFVVGERVGTSFDILGQWLNEGHTLGNMTYSNQDLNEIGIENFIENIRLGGEAIEQMIEGFGQKKHYFRYPFLHYGDNVETKRQIEMYLEHMDYSVAHATVIPEDYLYNLTLEKLGKVPDSIAFWSLMNEYVNHVIDEVERQEAMAMELMGRPVRQILLLHFNRLNAVFLEEIILALKDIGYEFVTLDRALADDVYTMPEGYFEGRGVSYLEMVIKSNPDMLPAQPR